MQWIQIIIFLLAVNGLFALFSVRFNDFLHVLASTRKSSLQDDVVNIIPLGSHQFPASEPPGNFFLESHLRHKI